MLIQKGAVMKPHHVVRENGYRTHIPQDPVRLQTAPTGLGTPKLTPMVRLQTAPTGNGAN